MMASKPSYQDLEKRIQELEAAESAYKKTEDALREREKELRRLAEVNAIIAKIGRIINSSLDIDHVYDRFAEEVRKIIPFDRISINHVNLKDRVSHISHVSGMDMPGRLKGDAVPLVGTITEHVISTRKSLIVRIDEIKEDEDKYPGISRFFEAGFQSLMSIPLFSKDEIIGIIHFQSTRPQMYFEKDLMLAEQVGNQITSAIANSQLFAERINAEKNLKESEQRYKSMFDDNPTVIYLRDPLTPRFIDVNPAAASFYGYSREDMKGMELTKITGGDLERLERRAKHSLTEGKNHFFATHYLANGEKRDVEIYNGPITIGDKKVIYGIVHDVTERRKSEKALRESENRYRTIFEHAGFGINLVDLETGKYVEFNQMAYESLGYTYEEYKNLTPQDFNIDETKESFKERRKKVIEEGSVFVESRQRTKNGKIIHKLISIVPVTINGKQYLQTINIDITDFKRAQEEKIKLESQLRQAQRIEAIGTLAGGIAHDLNNILTPVLIHSEIGMMALSTDHPVQYNLQQIFQAGERAREMVRQILAFSRHHQQEKTPIKLSSVLEETLKLTRSAIPTTIDIQHNIQTKADTVMADPTQIQQVIINICTNASQAMGEKGGVLEITLDDLHLDSKAVRRFTDLKPGPYVRLTIRDTGEGIEPEILDKIFDPYFTTKDRGEGTGMGLAVVHGIVLGHHGDIAVESLPGRGTTFHVMLPRIEAEASPISGVTESPKLLPRGDERVLFVDDEKAVVDSIKRVLERLGYRVTAATSSVEALEIFREKADHFDIVITDMTMPGMTGKDLAKKLISLRPEIPIILCTGFSEQIDEKTAKAMGIRAYMMKPVVLNELALKIREVLDT